MEKVIIEKLDNQGRGICFINNKITFIPNTLPTEEVEVEIVKESKKFNEAKVINYIKQSPIRIPSICPYFENCGGCDLLHSSYKDTIKYKKEKLESILYKYAHLKKDIEIVECDNHLNYRNKITLKVQDGKYGYYIMDTHDLIEIDNCYLAEEPINDFIKDLKHLNMRNGQVIIRCNYNQELLIWLKSKEKVNPDIEYLKSKHKIVGIVLNEKVLVGEPSFIEIINHMLFTISYDSFFQVNRNICSKLFNLIEDEIDEDEVILDLYCGVGTLGINATKKAKKAYGIEIVKNAVLNAITNSKINKRDNIYYMLGDVGTTLPKIKDTIDTIIVDPPRAGLDNITKQTILEFKANKIIYVSCDPMTLARDLKELQEVYNIKSIKGLDMFPMTHHCESITVLERR